MASALLVIVPFVLVFRLVFKEIRRQKRKWAALHELSRRLEELKQGILVVATPTVPDKKIEQELGEISAESAVSGSSYRLVEKKALIALMLTAKEKGQMRLQASTGNVLRMMQPGRYSGRQKQFAWPEKQ